MQAKILVVEDELILAEDLRINLGAMGYSIPAIVVSGEEAVRIARKIKPDLVLMDIKLRGELDGVAAAAQIRAHLDVPVVYLTALSDDVTLQRAKVTEPFGYIHKPIEMGELRSTVEMALYRHRMDQKLKERQMYLEGVLSAVPDAIVTLDAEHKVVEWNPGAQRLFGYTPQEAIGWDLDNLITNPDVFDEAVGFTRTALNRQPVGPLETVRYRQDGSPLDVILSGAPIFVGDELVGLVSVYTDITARKRAERALQESEQQFRDLFEDLSIPCWTFDRQGTILHWNRACEELYGWTADQVVGQTMYGLMVKDENVALTQEKIAAVFQGRSFHGVEYQDLRADGTLCHVLVNEYPLRDATGEVVLGICAELDITDRKRAEVALREERDKAQRYLDVAGVIIVSLDADQKVTLVNTKGCETLGYEKNEIIGRNWFDTFVPEQVRDEVKASFEDLMAGRVERVEYFENPILTPGGQERLVAWHNTVLRDEAGEIIGTLSSGEDITDRRRAEEALERRVAQLALLNDIGGQIAAVLELDRVLDRTAHLVQENFGYHHVALFTLDRERGEFVMRARAGAFVALFPPEHRVPLGRGMVGWVGQHGQTLLANDVDAEPRYINFYPDVIPTRSELSVPIKVGQEVVGALDVQSPSLQAFDRDDVMVMETLASQIAVAIKNARLVEGLEAEVTARTAEIRIEQQKIEAILRSVGDAISVTDLEMRVQYVNAAYTAQTGYEPEEVIGQPTRFLLGDQMPEQDWQSLLVALETGASWQGEAVLRRKDGRIFDAALTFSPVRDAAGQLVGYVNSHRDISRLKELERARTRFLTNVSHQLRTPVTNLKLYTHMLQKGGPEKAAGYLQVLKELVNRLEHLMQDILESRFCARHRWGCRHTLPEPVRSVWSGFGGAAGAARSFAGEGRQCPANSSPGRAG
jgi:PAS domain S-box-containing protein